MFPHRLIFVDDGVIYREITKPGDTLLLQADLNYLQAWCTQWLMKLKVNKCKVMRVCRNSNAPALYPYFLNNAILEAVS